MKLSVWAPFAASVHLVAADRRRSLDRDPQGQWSIDVDEADLRDGYRYSVDGGPPLPDPRSTWQPQGVHGPSHVARLDRSSTRAATFRQRPLSDAVIYEMHVGTFTPEGTYAAARAKLDHLANLGITHVEMMPVATFPGDRGWGYDGVDLYAPFPAYGTPEELLAFVEDCHAHGLAVLLDVVYNHFGPDGNYWQQYGPYATDRVRTQWGPSLNFAGPHSDPVREFVRDNALMWLRDYGIDGLRLDAVDTMFSTGAVHILEELSVAVRRLAQELNRPLVLIAESDANEPRLVLPFAQGGYQLDAHWVDDFHHSLHRFFTGESTGYYADYRGLEDIARALDDAYVHQGRYSDHRKRRHGRPPIGIRPDHVVVSAQNHDQIGNRAFGERLSMLLDAQQLKAVAALTLLSPFVPLLFQGEEWGARTPFLYFTDHADPALGAALAEGRRRDHHHADGSPADVPNPQARATFERSRLDWSELATPEHAQLLSWYRALIQIRRSKPAPLRAARAEVRFDAREGWLTFIHADVLAAFNLDRRPRKVPLPAGPWRLLLYSDTPADASMETFGGGATRIYRRVS